MTVSPLIQQALGIVARRAKDLALHEHLGARVGWKAPRPGGCCYHGEA